jgi:hypothetical protein
MRLVIMQGGQLLMLQELPVHADDKDLFVVGSIENADPAPFRNADGVTPQEIVREFLRRRLLERMDPAALRIDTRHDVLDGSVLARSVHGLKDQKQRPTILRVEHVLLSREPFRSALQELRRVALVHFQAPRVSWVEILQLKAFALRDAVWLDVLLDALQDFFSRHLASSPQGLDDCRKLKTRKLSVFGSSPTPRATRPPIVSLTRDTVIEARLPISCS